MRAKNLSWYEFWTIDELRKVGPWQTAWRRTWNWPLLWINPFSYPLIHRFNFCAVLQGL